MYTWKKQIDWGVWPSSRHLSPASRIEPVLGSIVPRVTMFNLLRKEMKVVLFSL